MLLPVQGAGWGSGTAVSDSVLRRLDGEIAYWLAERAPAVRWILPARIDAELRRSPVLDIRPRELAVGAFRRAEVKRIGDPLFGDIRRLAAIFEARYALVPVGAAIQPDSAGTGYAVEIAVAVIDAMNGYVGWFGVTRGDAVPALDDRAVASAAQRMADAFARESQTSGK